MKRVFAVTGATGHLGRYVVSNLLEAGEDVRILLLDGDSYQNPNPDSQAEAKSFIGNVCDPESLRPFLAHDARTELIVIHCAGIISIADQADPRVYDVNVNGTKNMLAAAQEAGVKRFVYVSSVHAIPELPKSEVQTEVAFFNPDLVVGDYAKTKAIATQCVLDAGKEGMDVIVLHPSGIIGPNSLMSGNTTKMIISFLRGHLPVAVKGGFDFVDVRDVARGVLLAVDKGRSGEAYILSNEYFSIRSLLNYLAGIAKCRRTLVYLSPQLVRLFVPLIDVISKVRRRLPIFTGYSMYTLSQNARYSHQKATRELGYRTRNIIATLTDTVKWLKADGLVR